jgi:hypothetical protein
MKEIWKDIDFIEGFEELYQVSNLGRVKSLGRTIYYPNSCYNKTNEGVFRPERILKAKTKRYAGVTLSNSKKKIYPSTHRLVALAFIPNPNNKPCVNHIDGDKQNNCVSNLEWLNWDENTNHAWQTGLAKPIYGKAHTSYKHGKYAKKFVKC